ncbi:hypothetical protein ACNOYE_17135 [Nannocystaceae bacterium ST9]
MDDDDSIDDAVIFQQGRVLIESIVNLALNVPAGGDARWDAMLVALGVRGMAPDERARQLKDGPGQSKGALLIEVRWALEAAIAPLAEHMDERWALRDFSHAALRDYVGAVKPRISTSSIFANALATTTNMMTGQAGAAAERCGCCGAPLVDRSRSTCRFCGEPM